MSFIGLLAVIASVVFGIKSGSTDFFVLAGLIFIGTCILEIPRMIHKRLIQTLTVITDALNESLEEMKKNQNNTEINEEWVRNVLEKKQNSEE